MRREIQTSSSHMKELCDPLSHTQELYHDIVVQEHARSDVMASLPVGQAHVERITSSLPECGATSHAGRGERPHASQDKNKHFCRDQCWPKGNPFATFLPPWTLVPRPPTTQANSGGTPSTRRGSHHNIYDGTSQFGEEKSRQKNAEKMEFGTWPLYMTSRM